METRASYILVGSFVLAFVAAIAGAAMWFSKTEFDRVAVRYRIHFTGNVTGLDVGSAVRYRGVPVGNVVDIRIDPADVERIRVTIKVDTSTPIKQDTVASLGIQGITGIAFIQLSGGTQPSPRLVSARKGDLPVIRSQPSELEKVLEAAPKIFSQVVILAERLSRLVDDRNLKSVAESLENVRMLTARLNDEKGDLNRTMAEGRASMEALRRTAGSAKKLTSELREKMGPIIDGAGDAVTELKSTMTELRATTRSINGVATQISEVINDSRDPLRDFSQVGLYELSQFIAEARELVAALTRLSQRIERDPARFFFGDTQKGYKPE